MDFTKIPYAEDLCEEVAKVVDLYIYRGVKTEVVLAILKQMVEDLELELEDE